MKYFLILALFALNVFAAGKIQDADVKTLAELTAAGGSAAQLINDSKIYVTGANLNQTLSSAITAGLIGGGGGSGINILANKGFESGISVSYTNVGGTYAVGATTLYQSVSAAFTASASGQYFESAAQVVPVALYGANCMARLLYVGGDANEYLTVMDGSSVEIIPTTSRLTLNSSTGTKEAKLYFTCPSSGSLKYRVQSTAAAAIATFDEGILGASDFLPTKQASSIGQLKYLGAASCSWTTTSTSYVNLGAVTACNAPVVRGQLVAPATKIPGFVLPFAPKGIYKITAAGSFGKFGGADGESSWRFSDGTNFSGQNNNRNNTSFQSVPNITGTIELLSDQTNWTVQIQALTTNASNSSTIEDAVVGVQQLTFDVEFYPSGTDTVVNSKCPNDIACENIYSASFSATGVTSSENLDFINGNCTNPSGGTYNCTYNTGIFSVKPNCQISTTNTVSVTSQGATLFNEASTGFSVQTLVNGAAGNLPFNVTCQKAGVDFKAKQTIQGFLASTVTSSVNNLKIVKSRVAGASDSTVCSTSPCTIYRSTGDISTVTRVATGQYIVNFNAGTFSETPSCSFGVSVTAGSGFAGYNGTAGTSSTSVSPVTHNPSGVNTDSIFDITCIGAR